MYSIQRQGQKHRIASPHRNLSITSASMHLFSLEQKNGRRFIWSSLIRWLRQLRNTLCNTDIEKTKRSLQCLTRMPATTRRVFGSSKAALQTNSSEQTNASKSESAIWRKWRLWLRCWSENRMEMVQRAAGELAAHFVFVVLPHHGRIPHGKIGIRGGGILQSLTKGSEWQFFSSMQFGIAGT